MWRNVRALLDEAGLDPPRVSFLAERLGSDEACIRPLLDKLGRIGWLCRASSAYFILPGTADRIAAEVRRLAAESPTGLLTVGRFREATGMSRHATMPVLEFFDRVGLTRRVRDGREVCGRWSNLGQ